MAVLQYHLLFFPLSSVNILVSLSVQLIPYLSVCLSAFSVRSSPFSGTFPVDDVDCCDCPSIRCDKCPTVPLPDCTRSECERIEYEVSG